MSIEKRIEYAEKRRDEAIANDSTYTVLYWNGYIEGLKAALRDANG